MSARATAWGAYRGITDALRRRIDEGEFAVDSLLPGEAALATQYGVSRNTLRRALTDLEHDGLIRTLPGRGRIVMSPGTPRDEAGDPHLQYRRIATDLRERITSGELRPGDLLPSEEALRNQYGVSRWTARQALVELQGAGLVEVVHGKGRFVREQPQQDV